MNHKVSGNSSKELLYSEYAGTTVVEHVLETLEKKSSKSIQDKIGGSFKNSGKSETFERVRKLMSLIEKEQDVSNASAENSKGKPNESTDNKEGVEVVMEVDENSPNSKVNAWFMLKPPKEQESKCDGNDDELEKNSSAERILDFSDSSDTSDNKSEQKFPVISNGFALNGTDSSNSSDDKEKVNPPHSSEIIKHYLNFLIDDSSESSDDELHHFPIISHGFTLNGTDSSNSVSDDEEFEPSDSSKLQNSSNFVNDDSTNSSDIKKGQFLSVSTTNGNLNSEESGTLQISLPLNNSKRIFEIPDDSSEDLKNDEFVKRSTSSSNGTKLLSEKKIKSNFVLNDSNYSLGRCEQNGANEKTCIKDNLNSSNGSCNVSMLGRKKVIDLKSESSKHLGKETVKCLPKRSLELKRKLCVLENEIPSVCDVANAKKSLQGSSDSNL